MAEIENWISPDTGGGRALRDALGCFATGVAIVTSVGVDGGKLGMTVNSFSSVSLDPPLVLFSIAQDAYSAQAFVDSGQFAVNLLSCSQEALSKLFSTALADKWDGIEYAETASGCPYFTKALAVFDCRIRDRYNGGDHIIVVGEVLSFNRGPSGEPLLFYRGAYRGMS